MRDIVRPHHSKKTTFAEDRWIVPKSWKWACAGQIAQIVGGGTPKRSKEQENYNSSGIPWITPADLSGYQNVYISRGARSLSEKGFVNSSARLMPSGTVLFTSRAPIGYCVIAKNKITTNQGFRSFVLMDGLAPEYLRYYLLYSKDYIRNFASGTTFKELSGSATAKISIPLPPTNEQKRIANRIDELFSKVDEGEENVKRVRVLLKNYRQSALKAAVMGELTREWRKLKNDKLESGGQLLQRILKARREAWENAEIAKLSTKGKVPKNEKWKEKYKEPICPDTSALPELPNGWVWASVDQLAAIEPNSIVDGPFGSNLKTSHYTEIGPRVIRLENIGAGQFIGHQTHISESHFKKLRKHQIFPNDIVIASLGSPLPRACIVPDDLGDAIVKADCIRFKPFVGELDISYLMFCFNSDLMHRIAKAAIHGVGRPRLNLGDIRGLPIPLPSHTEQMRIRDLVSSIFSRAEHIEREIGKMLAQVTSQRQSVLKTSFSGRLVPQNPRDEPASKLLERIVEARANEFSQRKPRGRYSRRWPSKQRGLPL